jgi:hypothetical protein
MWLLYGRIHFGVRWLAAAFVAAKYQATNELGEACLARLGYFKYAEAKKS